jgi:hypothetical protein
MYILAAIAVVIGTLICIANWYALIVTASGRRHISVAPLVGATSLFFGLRGFPATESWAWLSPLADWGTLSLLIALPQLYRHAQETSLQNLLHSFVSEGKGRRCEIRLFKSGRFTARVRYDPALWCSRSGNGHVERGFGGTWREDPDGYLLEGYAGGRRLAIHLTDGSPRTVESDSGGGCCSWDSLDSLNLTQTV